MTMDSTSEVLSNLSFANSLNEQLQTRINHFKLNFYKITKRNLHPRSLKKSSIIKKLHVKLKTNLT